MIYVVPGALAGTAFYLLLVGVNAAVERIWSRQRRLRAHSRLVIYCLVAVAFTFFIVMAGGGNWATHMQIAGFLLSGCIFSSMTALADASSSRLPDKKSAAPQSEGGAGTSWGSG
ncbi:hypothetical protein B841_03720 [Corynebacterium maris DSM 45190]|uniref:Uncharacterized protein n=1 Tax=Corynebacterium maris DSM 45190 TaxID=1224163 RepID=S5ST42_9CORY|nr:hypothetical protein [Corynebacterium maris]AGS34227.1 hypothetical protein B841_03720 [Corynebacterium maris DSM 45190]